MISLIRQEGHKTVSAQLLPLLDLSDPQICLQLNISFGTASWASIEFERTRRKVTANMERNVLKHHTELTCLYRIASCIRDRWVQQGIKSSVILPSSLKLKPVSGTYGKRARFGTWYNIKRHSTLLCTGGVWLLGDGVASSCVVLVI
ncbi:uncharacterized protein TNCV_3742931 [Trichonephila clavipes]|nr:uncharacterized protein TNCV_3742931 [Trichonephila clavipes]